MDYESVKYVEGFVENIIFRNEDNGYTVLILYMMMKKSPVLEC